VNSISTSWVVVRADASKGSRIVASIGPGSRVQLGESRGSWRRIRARGLAGWVELHSSFVGARSPARARGLAER
jgi:SH3-like domain-containing protein